MHVWLLVYVSGSALSYLLQLPLELVRAAELGASLGAHGAGLLLQQLHLRAAQLRPHLRHVPLVGTLLLQLRA